MAIFTDLAEFNMLVHQVGGGEADDIYADVCGLETSTARAALRQSELTAEVSDDGAMDMTVVQMEYATQILKQRIKMKGMAEAAATMKAEGNTAPPTSGGTIPPMSFQCLRLTRILFVPASGVTLSGGKRGWRERTLEEWRLRR